MRPGPSSHDRGHPRRGRGGGGGRGRRQQHALKSRGKAKGPRSLDVALNQRLASWQVAAVNAGAPSSAGVEFYLAEYLGWEDGEDEEEVRDGEYRCWNGDEVYGEPEAYGGSVGEEECWGEGEGFAAEWGVEGVLLPDGVWMWGARVAGGGDYDVDAMEGAMAEVEQEGTVAEEEQEQELEEAAGTGLYETTAKWKKRQQMKGKQRREKDLLAGSATLCHKPQEDDAEEEEEYQSDIYQHVKKMKRQQERRTLYGDKEGEEEEEDGMEPRGMLERDVEHRETITEKEGEDPEELVADEHQETEVEEVEEQGADDDFGFCKVGLAWDYVGEEEWYVVGGVVEM